VVLEAAAIVVLVQLLRMASLKLLQFDDLINYMVDDVETNMKYFDQLTGTPLLENSPEILDAQKNMQTMSIRLDEYLNRFSELTGVEIRKTTSPKPPIVVD
jgi:hypothetical protein